MWWGAGAGVGRVLWAFYGLVSSGIEVLMKQTPSPHRPVFQHFVLKG